MSLRPNARLIKREKKIKCVVQENQETRQSHRNNITGGRRLPVNQTSPHTHTVGCLIVIHALIKKENLRNIQNKKFDQKSKPLKRSKGLLCKYLK
ncbi:hypothetical protein T12_366, partial [Trichinella patagoniensis]